MRIEDMITDVLKKSWSIFKKDFVTLIIATVIAIVGMIFIITIPPLIFGLYYICMQYMNGKKVQISDVFKGFNYFLRSWGLLFLMVLGVTIGFILLVIPGFLLLIVWQYAIALSLMENLGPVQALKRSYELGKKNFTFSLVLLVFTMVISAAGGITRIGVVLTCPFTILMMVIATKKLTAKTK